MAGENIVGIDLGTTYCSIARLTDEGKRAVLIENEDNQVATPSVVYIGEDGVIVGEKADRLGDIYPERMIRNPKRYLGSDRSWRIDGTKYTPVQASSFILRKLKSDAEQRIGRIDRAVVSVPAHFDSHRRDLTLESAERAGLKVLDLINEPVAAALSHVYDPDVGLDYEALLWDTDLVFSVYDLGGGTFDLSIVKYSGSQLQVLATTGDLILGGIDWNDQLAAHIVERVRKEHNVDLADAEHEAEYHQLLRNVEKAKRDLSDTAVFGPDDEVGVAASCNGKYFTYPVTRSLFEQITRDLVSRTKQLTTRLLKSHGGGKVSEIVVVGGASQMPMIANMLKSLPGIDTNRNLSPELSVAMGTAYYAGQIIGARGNRSLEIQNVCAHSLGVVVRNAAGEFVNHELIAANTQLPATARVTVKMWRDNQRRISFKLLQGDEQYEEGKPVLCKCTLENLPKGLSRKEKFDVDVNYDKSGRLQIVARHRHSGLLATVNHSMVDVPLVANG